MFEPRTVKTLTALFGAMTVGTLVLMLIEPRPIQAPNMPLIALTTPDAEVALPAITDIDVPLNNAWNKIVIHTSVEGPQVLKNCHWIIEPGDGRNPDAINVHPTDLWKRQQASAHVSPKNSAWNTESIGICLVGDFARQKPSPSQWKDLIKLTTDLQDKFTIPRTRVYTYHDIDGKVNSPGAAFPAREFNEALAAVR
jgi:hypothetical protein